MTDELTKNEKISAALKGKPRGRMTREARLARRDAMRQRGTAIGRPRNPGIAFRDAS